MTKAFVLITTLLSFHSVAWSYVGSVSSGTGEAGRATVEAGDSSYLNPASLAHMKGYFFSSSYGNASRTNAGNSRDLAFSLTDNMRDTVIPTALSYVQTTTDVSSNVQNIAKQFELNFGNYMTPAFAFGLGIAYRDDRSNDLQHFTQTNLKMGGLYAFNPDFGLGIVADNMIDPNTNVPETLRLKQTLGFGLNMNIRKVIRLRADVVSASNNNWGKPAVMGGVENYLNKWLILRVGAQKNNEYDYNLYSGGIGFVGPVFSLNYAYINSPQEETLTRHSVDLAIPIW